MTRLAVRLRLSCCLPDAVNFSVTLPAPRLTVTDPLATVFLPYLALTVCLPSLAPVSFSVRPCLSAAASLAFVTVSLTVAPGVGPGTVGTGFVGTGLVGPGFGPGPCGAGRAAGTSAGPQSGFEAPGRISLPPSVNWGHTPLAVNFGSVAMWTP